MKVNGLLKKSIITVKDFYNAVPTGTHRNAYRLFLHEGFIRILLISVVLTLLSSASIIMDLSVGFYSRATEPLNILNMAAFCILLLMSFIIITVYIYAHRKKISDTVYSNTHALFITALDISMLLFLFSEFMRGRFLCFQMFYLMFYAAVPLFRFKDNIVNALFMAGAITAEYLTALYYVPTTEHRIMNIIYLIFVIAGCFTFAMYLRSYSMSTIISACINDELAMKLKIKSEIDELTGCLNRYALAAAFLEYKAQKADITVMMVDFDDFKAYNDAFSHIKGDECLQRVSNAIRNVSGGCGFETYRFGGEEFLLVGQTPDDRGISLVRDILKAVGKLKLRTPNRIKHDYVSVSIGIGNAVLDDNSELNDIVALADRQVYLAKENGKACAYIDGKVLDSNGKE